MSDLHLSIAAAKPVFWTNPFRNRENAHVVPAHFDGKPIGMMAIREAHARFKRFAPLLSELFPELKATQGKIESELIPLAAMQQAMDLPTKMGRLWLKADQNLPVAGSVKARGGFHEVLEIAERIALHQGLINIGDDYRVLGQPKATNTFSSFQFAVGSTGNLGMGIGVMAAALGFRAVVHMSKEAKVWKKERLRNQGVEVIEHSGDYEKAVSLGRSLANADPLCHFVDDERSTSLFLGYSASAFHLHEQLRNRGILVNDAHPLIVYIPCGVGGAPSGIAWGLHHVFGKKNVHCYFAEPVQSPCFLIQMLSDAKSHPSVYDYGLNNCTEADGLAVPRASVLATETMRSIVAGVFTVDDSSLFRHLQLLQTAHALKIEPSAAAGFAGLPWIKDDVLACPGATHIAWATGGSLVPGHEYRKYLEWTQVI